MGKQTTKYPSNLADQSPCNLCTSAVIGCIKNCEKNNEWVGQCVNKLQELEKTMEKPEYNQQFMLELEKLVKERKMRKRKEHPAKTYLTETDVKILQLIDKLFYEGQ